MSNTYNSMEFNKGFVANLLDLAERVAKADGIRMDVTISFSYTRVDKEEI